MREVKRSALVSQPPGRVFALINDIERYPEFLPWCTHARVLERSASQIVATLGVRQGAFTGEFTTRNTLTPETAVLMQLVDGPFRTLEGRWQLTPIESLGCRVDLDVRFEFKSRVGGLLFEPLFAQTLGSLVEAFVRRARAGA
ncbi:MAG TPA: type II toxin-antitoxin system RatA family toxin [Steroidobacteraceae bacterium]|nr:type II toxin-antitoxin system RatA family toxin [Steroidobacteraceae bacterium]